MLNRPAVLILGFLLLAGCGGRVAYDRSPAPQPSTSRETGASQAPDLPEPSRSRRLPTRTSGAAPTPTATAIPPAPSDGTQSAAEQAFQDALTALPSSEFQAAYALVNAPTDALIVRWRPPQAAAEFSYLGMTYRVSGNSQTGAVEVCVKVAKRWVCDEQIEVQAVDPETLGAVLAAVNPEQVAAAGAELASLPGAQFRTDEIAGAPAHCVMASATTICLADTGAPLLADAVEQIELPGFSDISLRATDYNTDSGL